MFCLTVRTEQLYLYQLTATELLPVTHCCKQSIYWLNCHTNSFFLSLSLSLTNTAPPTHTHRLSDTLTRKIKTTQAKRCMTQVIFYSKRVERAWEVYMVMSVWGPICSSRDQFWPFYPAFVQSASLHMVNIIQYIHISEKSKSIFMVQRKRERERERWRETCNTEHLGNRAC